MRAMHINWNKLRIFQYERNCYEFRRCMNSPVASLRYLSFKSQTFREGRGREVKGQAIFNTPKDQFAVQQHKKTMNSTENHMWLLEKNNRGDESSLWWGWWCSTNIIRMHNGNFFSGGRKLKAMEVHPSVNGCFPFIVLALQQWMECL